MKNRPGEHARQEIRAGWLRALGKHLSLWITLMLVVVICLLLFAIIPMPSSIRGFWIGFVVAGALAGFAWMLQILSNTHGWSMGKVGEEATAQAVTPCFWVCLDARLPRSDHIRPGNGSVDNPTFGVRDAEDQSARPTPLGGRSVEYFITVIFKVWNLSLSEAPTRLIQIELPKFWDHRIEFFRYQHATRVLEADEASVKEMIYMGRQQQTVASV